jgi:hypothetical protein
MILLNARVLPNSSVLKARTFGNARSKKRRPEALAAAAAESRLSNTEVTSPEGR